jgi:hypothetical protein
VAIARAIVNDPKIIVADEPTGDLDRKSADEILNLLEKLNKEFKKTILMVTHDPHAAERATVTRRLDKGASSEPRHVARKNVGRNKLPHLAHRARRGGGGAGLRHAPHGARGLQRRRHYAAKDRIAIRHKVSFILPLPKPYIETVRGVPGVKRHLTPTGSAGRTPRTREGVLRHLAVDPATCLEVFDEVIVPPAESRRPGSPTARAPSSATCSRGSWASRWATASPSRGTIYPGDWQFTSPASTRPRGARSIAPSSSSTGTT